MLPPFPMAQGAGIDAQAAGQLFLAEAEESTMGNDPLTKGLALSIVGYIAQELDDPWYEAKRRGCSVDLPVADGILIDTELLSHLPLEELQVEPPLSQMVPGSSIPWDRQVRVVSGPLG